MGICCALPDVVQARRRAAGLSVAGGVQCGALRGARRHSVAHDAQRPAAVAGGLSADAALDGGGLFPDDGRGSLLSGISFFDPESVQLYRSWGRLQGQKNVRVENASVCGGTAWQFASVLAWPAS